MKKIITLFIFFICYVTSAQCELSFEEILKNSVANSSDFDTFALNNGYTFDAENKTYFCTSNPNTPIKENSLRRYIDKSILNINHSTYSKDSYLDFKSKLSLMGFKYTGTVNYNNMTAYNFSANNIDVTLASQTNDMETNYLLIIKVDLNKK